MVQDRAIFTMADE